MRILLSLIGLLLAASHVVAAGPPPAKVVLGDVVKEDVSTTQSVTGVLYYERVSDISTEVVGLVEEIKVSQGDRVKKGDLLVRLNTEILEREIALNRTRIEQIELRIKNAEKNFKRLERLFNSSGVSEKDFDDALYSFQDAQKEKQAVGDGLAKLLIQQRRSLIKAPFDGVVLTKEVDSGAWVQQGKVLVSIGSSDDLFVRAPIAENLLQFIRLGENVQVVLNAFNKELEGSVIGIDPVADIKTKNIFLKIKIPSMDLVAQNMSANVFVPSSEKRELSVFSRAALIKFQGKDFVYSVKEGKAAILPVNIVAYMGQKVAADNPYIVPGLPIVVEGNERLRPDQPVMVAGEK
ncbi:MAG: efflux RND transporter periplasmic adaptor subunit [Desulfobulbaceae bacterium]|nr:efflux RND transporter periplasmic adaptor subunit [Desulfobulbaceae bacterium]